MGGDRRCPHRDRGHLERPRIGRSISERLIRARSGKAEEEGALVLSAG